MRFIVALVALSLIITGCGQSSRNSSPPAPQVSSPPAGDQSAATNENTPAEQSPTLAPESSKSGEVSPGDIETDPAAAALEQQIGYQQGLLYKEDAALKKAIREKNNQVHLGADFM